MCARLNQEQSLMGFIKTDGSQGHFVAPALPKVMAKQ